MNMLNTFRRDNSITSDKDTNNNDKYNERVHTQPFECINGVVVWLHSADFFLFNHWTLHYIWFES